MRQRIFTAIKAGDLPRVRRLQKLMLRSRANTLVSVRRVTERNAGRLTAGVDGEVVLTPEAKESLVDRVQHHAEPFKAQPVRRVYIPKPGQQEAATARDSRDPRPRASSTGRRTRWSPSGRRGLSRGPMDFGRAVAAMTRSRPSIRPPRVKARGGSGCWTQTWPGRLTRIAHDHILAMLGTFPARGMVEQWLKAGVVENGRLLRTEEGTPQGGVVSPVLLNVALHGMETGRRSQLRTGGMPARRQDSPVLIRYADDLVALCHSRQQAHRGQGAARRLAGAQGSVLQRGQDADRHPR